MARQLYPTAGQNLAGYHLLSVLLGYGHIRLGMYIHVFTSPLLSAKMYAYIHSYFLRHDMANTKLFKNGNSQAVRIPAELAYSSWDIELVIEREGDELRIRPAQRRMGDVLGKLAKFSPDFMSEGRGLNVEGDREAL